MNFKFLIIGILSLGFIITPVKAEHNNQIIYKIEMSGNFSSGSFAPLWLIGNRYGMRNIENNQGYLRIGTDATFQLGHHWNIEGGLDLATGLNTQSTIWLQQAFVDLRRKQFCLSIGSQERTFFPLQKDLQLSSGMLVEGINTRPIPQVRISFDDFVGIPFFNNWIGFKGHIAYGKFFDEKWQEKFAAPNSTFLKNVLYHSKSLALKIGNKLHFPLEFEIALSNAAQFGGTIYNKEKDGSCTLNKRLPKGLKSFWKIFFPTEENALDYVEGNHVGSWSSSLSWKSKNWQMRIYMEHYFEDRSQMFMEYGFWKDGQIGIEASLPRNRWINKILVEILNTTDQSGPVRYIGNVGSNPGVEISGDDNYFNNGEYNAWQYAGLGLTIPIIPGPAYNDDHSIHYRSNRVKALHLGLSGTPTAQWSWRILASHVKHWGTYSLPLKKVLKQWNTLIETTYISQKLKGFSTTFALGIDHGNYLGNNSGLSITIRKEGSIYSWK